jgi:hypothetical protein
VSAAIIVIVIVIVIGLILLVNAGTSAAIETAFDKAGRSMQDRRKPKGTFLTALSVADALEAGREAAAEIGAADGVQESEPSELAITLPSGAAIRLIATPELPNGVKVKVGTAKESPPDNDLMSRFLGAMLAALRRRDLTARQAAK